MKTLTFIAALALILAIPAEAGKIQKQGIKTEAECVTAGATAATCLPEDKQVFVTAKSINKTLDDAITDGNIGGAKNMGTFTGTAITPTSVDATDESWTYTGTSSQTFTGVGTLSSLTNGKRFTVIGSGSYVLTMAHNDATNGWLLNGDLELAAGDMVTLEYNSTLARLVELARSVK